MVEYTEIDFADKDQQLKCFLGWPCQNHGVWPCAGFTSSTLMGKQHSYWWFLEVRDKIRRIKAFIDIKHSKASSLKLYEFLFV